MPFVPTDSTNERQHRTVLASTVNELLKVPTWTAPTLLNSWVNYDSNHNPAGYYKDHSGRVYLRGVIRGGASATVAFTLPAGYRPEFKTLCVGTGYGDTSGPVAIRVDIETDGDVIIDAQSRVSGTNQDFEIDAVSFLAYQ